MAYRDDEIAAGKKMGFAERYPALPQLRSARSNEQMAAIFLELGALVDGNGVFQRQFVQPELLAQLGDGAAVRRSQLDPDEIIRIADVLADILQRDGVGRFGPEQQTVDNGFQLQTGASPIATTNIARLADVVALAQWFDDIPDADHVGRNSDQIALADLDGGAAFGGDDCPAFEYVADLVLEILPRKPGDFLFPDLPMFDAEAGELFRARAGFYDDLRHFDLPLSL